MNPGQLWSTTMDPEHRALLQVKIEDAARADEVPLLGPPLGAQDRHHGERFRVG